MRFPRTSLKTKDTEKRMDNSDNRHVNQQMIKGKNVVVHEVEITSGQLERPNHMGSCRLDGHCNFVAVSDHNLKQLK